MTLCPHTRRACHCQPQEGIMCPHGPTPDDWQETTQMTNAVTGPDGFTLDGLISNLECGHDVAFEDLPAVLRALRELRQYREIVGYEPADSSPEPADEPEPPETYPLDFALRIARLWRAGKMIGGDEDAVRNTLLAEIERLSENRKGKS